MRSWAFLILLGALVTNCCPRIVSKTTVDTVYVEKPVYIPEKTGFFTDVLLTDSITVADPDLELNLIPQESGKVKIKYEIKRDTVRIEMPQLTITETVVKEKKVTAWWSYVVLGVGLLIALLALLRR